MTLKIPVWMLIPSLALFTLLFFPAFKGYSVQEWTNGIMAISLFVGMIYLGEAIYKTHKKIPLGD